MEIMANWDREEDPEPKAFKKKCPNIPSRDSYKEAELEKDDEVAIFAYHGNLCDGAWHYTHFTGHLL